MANAEDELLTVVVCCLNEEDNIRDTIESVTDLAPDLPLEVEVLMVDDGSTDRTQAMMEDLCEEHDRCRMLVNEQNRGLGASIVRAYDHIREGSWVTDLPGDNEFYFESIWNLLELRDQYDVILGYPANPVVRPLKRRVLSKAYLRLAQFLFGLEYRYLNGMQLYRLEAFKGLDIVNQGHGFTAELLSKAILRDPQLKVGECPFYLRGRKAGESKAFRPSEVTRAIRDMVRAFQSVSEARDRRFATE